jgi:hypothetical protein
MSSPLRSLLAMPSKQKGRGFSNSGGYSNPALDTLIDKGAGDDRR